MDPFIGQIILFGGNFAPRGWALCQGQLLSIPENTALFSILGTTYGGDGRTTFGLPDLRGRVATGTGNGPGLQPAQLGAKKGVETNTLTTANLPQSAVLIPSSSDDATSDEPTNMAAALTATPAYGSPTAGESMAKGSIQGASSSPVNNLQPSLALNYIIALQGTYPSRS